MMDSSVDMPIFQKLKTQPSRDLDLDQFRENLFSPTFEFIKEHPPFLENKKIIFNTRSIRKKQNPICFADQKKTQVGEETNIDKLKRQIKQLDKDDFISYRSKTSSYMEEHRVIDNPSINKYNHQNSLIAELKGQTCLYKPIFHRPKTTISVSGKVSRNCANSSMPYKYFSKPKKNTNTE